MKRDLEHARNAYANRDVELSRNAHNAVHDDNKKDSVKLIFIVASHGEKHQSGGEYIKSAVYGGMDGIVTTYSVVMGVLGANLSIGVVLALGLANLFGDGLSMALGDYLSTKAEKEYQEKERLREEWEVDNNLSGEKSEMIQIYKAKGMAVEDAIKMTDAISKNKQAFVDIMMVEELGLSPADENPVKNALVTFTSFLLFGIIPLIPFIVGTIAHVQEQLFIVSTVMTAVFMFILGVSKSMFTYSKWYYSGMETISIGALSALASYLIGLAFEGVAKQD